MGAILFFSFAVILLIAFLKPALINIKVGRYLKKYHRVFWEDYNRIGGFGGPNPFEAIESLGGLDDPQIEAYKKEWDRAVKQFLLLFIAIITLFFVIFVIASISVVYNTGRFWGK